MKVLIGNRNLVVIHEYDLNVSTTYLEEREHFIQKIEDRYSDKEFPFVSKLTYRTRYLIYEKTKPYDDTKKRKKSKLQKGDVLDQLFSKATKGYKERPLPELPDLDPSKVKEEKTIEKRRIVPEHEKAMDRWNKLEEEKKFFGDTHFFLRDKLYLLSGCGPEDVHLIIEQSDNDDFELFFAFKLRFLTNLEERKAFIGYWRSKYKGDFALFLETLLVSHKALFDKAKRLSIRKLITSLQEVIPPQVTTSLKTVVLPKIVNPLDLEPIENPDEIEIDMNREELIILLSYVLNHRNSANNVEPIKDTEVVQVGHLLTETKFSTYTDSHFRKHISKSKGDKKYNESYLKKLEKIEKRLNDVKLTYISGDVKRDIKSIQEKIKKNKE